MRELVSISISIFSGIISVNRALSAPIISLKVGESDTENYAEEVIHLTKAKDL